MGWASELSENAIIIHVDYDLPNLQQGVIPSGSAEGRVFRLVKMSTGMIYPASTTCELVPEYADTFSDAQYNYDNTSFNLLNEGN